MKRLLFTYSPVFLILMLTISCSDDEENPQTSQPPVFSVTPVDIAFNPADSSYGDIVFTEPVLRPFGTHLGNNEYVYGIEYFVSTDAKVRAVAEGIVDAIIENPIEEGDYEVRVVALPGSDYIVIYDNVVNPEILDGSYIVPGDIIGDAGYWNDYMGRTSLKISTGEGSNERFYCPLNYGNENFIQLHRALLTEYNRRGFSPYYDTLCLQSFMTPDF